MEFTVTLLSSQNSNNRPTSFTNRLSEKLNLSGYECGLTDIIFPSPRSTLTTQLWYEITNARGETWRFDTKKKETFKSIQEVIDALV